MRFDDRFQNLREEKIRTKFFDATRNYFSPGHFGEKLRAYFKH